MYTSVLFLWRQNHAIVSALAVRISQPTALTRGDSTLSPLVYSKTSDSGPSKIGTVYNRPLYKGHCSRSQIFTVPIVL